MPLMKAYRLIEWGRPCEFVDVPVPTPGPGEVLLRMAGAGLCRSDIDIMDAHPGEPPLASVLPAGFTMGHENAGHVAALGAGVTDLAEGAAVAVHHMHSCGHCDFCLQGVDQHCSTHAIGAISLARGVGMDGGLAPWLVVPRHELVPIGTLDPIDAAPLTDAGVTAYHAVRTVTDRLRPGTTAVVVGIGGLGGYGVQFLKLLTAARVIALDITAGRLRRGLELGADCTLLTDDAAYEQIMDLTGGRGAEAIVDFVGSNATLALAARVSRPQGRIVLVGMAGGSLSIGWGSPASSCEVSISMGSTRADLLDVCALAQMGRLSIDRDVFAFDDVGVAYDRLRAGQINGRAVIRFD